jgi:hypothetical protein
VPVEVLQEEPGSLVLRLPNFSTACTAQVCYFGIELINSPVSADAQHAGGTFRCPPDAEAHEQQCTTSLRAVQSGDAERAANKSAVRSFHTVRYVRQCAGFLPAGSPACFEQASASGCAWGTDDSCRPCPEGAICPGAASSHLHSISPTTSIRRFLLPRFAQLQILTWHSGHGSGTDHSSCHRLVRSNGGAGGKEIRTFPGYYAASASTLQVSACPPPATARCIEWDSTAQRTSCGFGYAGPSASSGCGPWPARCDVNGACCWCSQAKCAHCA